jgi:hypothetical protein
MGDFGATTQVIPSGQEDEAFSFWQTRTQWLAALNGTQLAFASAPEGASEQSASETQRLEHAQPAATLGVSLPTPKQGTVAPWQSLDAPWHSSA